MNQVLNPAFAAAATPVKLSLIESVIDSARWAPSGDNTQPWRFEFVDELHVAVHAFDTRDHCVYDLDGRPSQMAIGALIETAAIAASAHGLRMRCERRPGTPDIKPVFDLEFAADPVLPRDPLYEVIETRTVQRRPYATTPLTAAQRAALKSSVGADCSVRWIEGGAARLSMAHLMFRSAWLRLVTPEAYQVHRGVIEWGARFSEDKVPDQALGVNRATLMIMHFAMQSWTRVQFLNRFMAGTWLPRMQMDFLPAWACGAHFMLVARDPPLGFDDNIRAGRAMQRFWLTATRLGLLLQPEMTPLIFARYANEGRHFSSVPSAPAAAKQVARTLAGIMGDDAVGRGFFLGRVGSAPTPLSRSLRKPLAALRWPAQE